MKTERLSLFDVMPVTPVTGPIDEQSDCFPDAGTHVSGLTANGEMVSIYPSQKEGFYFFAITDKEYKTSGDMRPVNGTMLEWIIAKCYKVDIDTIEVWYVWKDSREPGKYNPAFSADAIKEWLTGIN